MNLKAEHKLQRSLKTNHTEKNNITVLNNVINFVTSPLLTRHKKYPHFAMNKHKPSKMRHKFRGTDAIRSTIIDVNKGLESKHVDEWFEIKETFIPRIGDYSYFMRVYDFKKKGESPIHETFKTLHSEVPVYFKLFERTVMRILNGSYITRIKGGCDDQCPFYGIRPLRRMIKIALIFGEEKYDFMRRVDKIEDQYEEFVSEKNKTGTPTKKRKVTYERTVKWFADYLRSSLNGWSEHVVEVFSVGLGYKTPITVDQFIEAFESQTKWFSPENSKMAVHSFKWAIKKSGGMVKLLNPKYFL